VHDFRKLDVYRRSIVFTKAVRQTTSAFPKNELYALASQFHRAADSIALNVAEGSGNDSKREFAKFLNYSMRSGYECGCCTDIAMVQKYISKNEYLKLTKEINEIISMLVGLKRSLER
jgi:four helix bundle protein